ncbi:MAG: C-terminal target protein [Hymenobacter sp.]|nr:C-terminal target protein [Hymenobacter sp.]
MIGNFTSGCSRLALMWLLVLLGTFPALAQAPPGNALNFVPSASNVVATGMDLPNFGGSFALEAWVRTTATLPNGIVVAVSSVENFYLGIDNYAADGHQGQALFHVGSTFISSQTRIDDGRWHHIAGTVTSNAATVYVDGVAEGTGSGYTSNYPDQGLNVGSYGPTGSSSGWPGSVDEVRVWSIARSATDIKASFNNVPTVPQTGLLVYYNFDRGTAGGNNAGVTTLPNLAGSGYTGTLSNFTLSGSTSNWVESYALVQPTSLAATSTASGTSLSVTWTAPPVGTVSNYVLDCSTTADYSAGVTTLTPASGTTSATVSGRTVNTRYWLRLRADKTSVTGQSAYSHDVFSLRTPSGLTAPGNALAFDGTDDYVALPNTTPVPTGNGTYTLEAWIKPNAMGIMGIMGWGNWGSTNQVNALRLSPTGIINYWWGPDLTVTTPDLSGHWHHVAATFDGTTRTIYLDGVAVGSDTPGGHAVPSPGNLRIGCTNGPNPGGGYEYFNGSIDEVRIWSVARSAADIKAAYTNQPAVPQAGLVAAYDFDAGTVAGANTTQTTLFDRTTNYQDGTLNNFALTSGNTTSNYVESYARVVPLATVSSVTTSGFTASWTAPAVGTVNGYVFEHSLSATFATGVTTLPLAAGATSQAVSGLLPNRNYYYRLRADKTSLIGTGAYASGPVRTLSALTPPGNALAFDGNDDYVAVSAAPKLDNLGKGSLTLESWVYTTNLPGVNSIIRKGGDYNLVLLQGGLLYAEVWPGGMGTPARPYATATAAIPQNRWTHVAATWDGTALRLYVNGVAALLTQGSSPVATSEGLQIGRSAVFSQPFAGRIDEVRIYNAALTAAQVQADMTSTSAAVPASLVAYYNFDQGTASGTNTAVSTLTDQSTTLADGTLTNFDLTSGNTTSNYVESYALVVPTLAAATGATATGFTVNWTAPAIGSADNGYSLDVATSTSFTGASVLSGSPFAVPAGTTSKALTGLASGQTYYYRLRADKTSVTGQGAYTPTVMQAPFAPMLPPGNALAFDGADDYVAGTTARLPQGNAPRTLEAWVLTTAANGVIFNYGTATTNLRSGILVSGGHLYYVGEGNDLPGIKAFNDGHWHHVAATYDGTTLKLYVDGVLDISSTPSAFNTTGLNWSIGKRIPPLTSTEQFNGRIDEARVYSTALTQAQVQADMTNTSAAVAGMVMYYNFDHGLAGGDNTGYTTLADQTGNGNPGTLTSFDLSSGNTTSNWVESYALLVPTGLTASATTGTGFTATWTAPTINGAAAPAGKVEGYALDVSANATFTLPITGSPFALNGAGSTSQAVAGLPNGTSYYLRVRAEKASVTGQGAYTPPVTTHTVGTDAYLTSLVSSAGVLSPAFASATTAYTLPLLAGQNTFTLMPVASNGYTTITVNGTAVASGTASASFAAGALVTLVLTSEDGQATRTYTVQSVNTPDYYRSAASGNWADAGTWEGSDDNATWSPVAFSPSVSLSPIVSIRSGHTVTVAADVQINRTIVLSGGTLTVAPGATLELFNAANPDLTVNGTLTVPAGAVLLVGRLSSANGYTGTSLRVATLTVSTGATFTADGVVLLNSGSTATNLTAGTSTFGAGSRVVLFATTAALVIPAATWAPTATLELAGAVANTSVAASLNGKTLGSMEVNLTGSGLHVLLSGTSTATLTGNLTVTSTGTGTLRLLVLANTTGGALTINGNYVQNGGTVNGCAAAAAALTAAATVAVNVTGSFTVAGGSFTANQANQATASTIRPNPLTIGGDLTVSSGATFSLVSALAASNNTTNVAAAAYVTSRVNLLGNFTNNGTFTTGSTLATNTGQQLYFAKAGVQTFANTGTIGSATNRVNATVNAGSTLDLGTSAFSGSGSFTTLAGGTLRLGSPVGISASGTATGNVQNTGARSLTAGSFEFYGPGAQATGTGFPATLAATASTLAFNNAAGVTLSQALTTAGTISLKQGVVTTTTTNLLTLGINATVAGTLDATTTNTGRVAGPFQRWIGTSTGSRDFPVGLATVSRPANITYTTAPTAGGTLTAEFIASPAGSQGLPLTEGSITVNKASGDGYWHFTAAAGLVDGTYTPTLTFAGIRGAADFTQLVLLKRADAASDWALVGAHIATTGSNAAPVLSRTGVSGFSDFTAGGDFNVNPLPVELVSFTARAQGSAVALSWRTATEKNSQAFEVERSADGATFARIGTVAAAGSSSAPRTYELLDTKLPDNAATLYYRLRQVDQDGTFNYSPVRSIVLKGAVAALSLYPNPTATGAATLTGAQPGTLVTVYDALGRPVLSAPADATGTAALLLPGGLPTGVYVVRAGNQALRLTVE